MTTKATLTQAVSTAQLPAVLLDVCSAGLVPMIIGSPGTAKSDSVAQFASNKNLYLITITLSTREPVDISGFPVNEDGRMSYVPLDEIPISTDKVPDGYAGFCLFFDEFNSALRQMQAACYRVILDRMIGQHKIHPKCVIICAGNNASDRAIVNELSTAMQSRLIHIPVKMLASDWLKWAATNKIDHRVCSFIEARPDLLHKFSPKHEDHTFACARTWSFLSRYITSKPKFSGVDLCVMSGTVSAAVATEFKIFCELYNKLPTFDEMLADPQGVTLSTEPSHQYALALLISYHTKATNIADIFPVIERLPLDFQVVCLQDILTKGEVDQSEPCLNSWIVTNADSLY